MLSLFRHQPRPFFMIFMLEIWERFGFYTMQGILTLYFIRQLGFSETKAYYTYGAFFAMVYALISIGGYLGDKILGCKRTIVLGLLTMAAGYLALSLVGREHIFTALGLICVGNGLFKANPANLLSKCYSEGDPRLHAGFTLYYMAVNLGSIFALLTGPYLSSHYGYPYAYFLSFIGILLALANYQFQKPSIAHIITEADARKVSLWQWNLIIIGILLLTQVVAFLLQHVMLAKQIVWLIISLAFIVYANYMRKESRPVRLSMLLAILLMAEAVLFFTLYHQMATSINLFALNNVQPYLFGIPIDPQSFQALNPLGIVLLSPLFAWFYGYFNRRGTGAAIPYKYALGMTACGLSFLILFASRYFANSEGIVHSNWLVLSYLFQSSAELLVSALGVAMVAELVPKAITGFVMGVWFLTSSLAGFVGAYVASFAALPDNVHPGPESLQLYTEVFAYIGLVTLGVSLILWLLAPFLARMTPKNSLV